MTTPPDDPRADEGLEAAVVALYQRHPTIFYDRVDGACEMAWQEAKAFVTIEWLEAIGNARAALAAARSHGGM